MGRKFALGPAVMQKMGDTPPDIILRCVPADYTLSKNLLFIYLIRVNICVLFTGDFLQ
jgi:hypothetical protein